jgi:NAD(P)-dependent dehydrogenase (short-subunit alcohol dehydrogenase family)
MKTPSRIIVITGVSRGLGRALTEKFIALGHVVLGCARSKREIDNLKRTFPKPHHFHVVDVSSDEEVKAWAEKTLKRDGPPDLLINNAAVMNHPAPLWEVPAEEFSTLIDVNIKGMANVIRHFVPAMVRKRSGVIVNLSSGWGRDTDPNVAPYCASKYAVEGLTKSLAQELPTGMAAVPLNPGIINTDMLRICFGGSAGDYADAQRWAKTAAPFFLKLNERHNGQSLSVGDEL